MASPQKENGYTAIANEILEAMAKIKLSPTQYRILFVIWRYTYGFNRKEHELSLSFLATATGCDKRQLQRELKGLDERKVIIQEIKSGAYRKIKFNKHYKQWVGETDIGKTTIGEIDNGEIDNIGETVNTTIGETVNTTIGEIDNQEIQTKDKYKDKEKNPFETALNEFKKMRNKIKKPMTDRAVNMLINKLNKLTDTEEEKIAILDQSIMNCWQDIYPLKDKQDKPKDNIRR